MSTGEITIDEVRGVTTASGARIMPIAAARARTFLTRLDEPAPQGIDVALGAIEGDGVLIGVAVLSASVRRGAAMVAVLPARRRLKVGSDLLDVLLHEAADRAVDYLTCHLRRPSVAADALLRAVGLITSAQTDDGVTTILAIVPEMTAGTDPTTAESRSDA